MLSSCSLHSCPFPQNCPASGVTSAARVYAPVDFLLLLLFPSAQGEARALLAAKAVALGEVLPPLHVVCYDAQGNEVPPAALVVAAAGGSAVSGSAEGGAAGASGGSSAGGDGGACKRCKSGRSG